MGLECQGEAFMGPLGIWRRGMCGSSLYQAARVETAFVFGEQGPHT